MVSFPKLAVHGRQLLQYLASRWQVRWFALTKGPPPDAMEYRTDTQLVHFLRRNFTLEGSDLYKCKTVPSEKSVYPRTNVSYVHTLTNLSCWQILIVLLKINSGSLSINSLKVLVLFFCSRFQL